MPSFVLIDHKCNCLYAILQLKNKEKKCKVKTDSPVACLSHLVLRYKSIALDKVAKFTSEQDPKHCQITICNQNKYKSYMILKSATKSNAQYNLILTTTSNIM